MSRNYIQIGLNGEWICVSGEDVFLPLSSFLRYARRKTGTKVVCAEGDCGACTVLVKKWHPSGGGQFLAVNSCIAPSFLFDGAQIYTVEAMAESGELSEVQDSMARNFGGQCGFCTPGMVMALTAMFEGTPPKCDQDVKNHLTGNLCRCTGYEPIIKAALDVDLKKIKACSSRSFSEVPLELIKQEVLIEASEKKLYSPTSIKDLVRFKKENANAMIFSGATDLGVRINKGHIRPEVFLSLNLMPEFYQCEYNDDEFVVGAKVTLKEFQDLIEANIPDAKAFMNIFASPQIKNMGTVVGNLVNASPIADTTPVLMSLDAELNIVGSAGARKLPLSQFYLGYKKIDLKPDEVILSLNFKKPASTAVMSNYKISKRRDLDISCVNASFLFDLKEGAIVKARMSFGGVGPMTLRLEDIENFLIGKKLSAELLTEVKFKIRNSIHPISDSRGSLEFRLLMAENLFDKFATEKLGL
jgi:xanthine dehydrogenase small subunit